MEYQNLLLSIENAALIITINRESKLNALNRQTLKELHIALSEAQKNDEVGGIIITGAGSKAFVAGADISEFRDFDVEQGTGLARQGQEEVFNLIENSAKPIIAAINGYALGGGLELALACHIRIGSESTQLGLPELTLGLIPGYGGTQRLPALVGKGKAMEMILSSKKVTASEALQIGLLNSVTKQEELLVEAKALMATILLNPPKAPEAAIKAINMFGTKEGYEHEINQFGSLFGTPEFNEGVSAFLEKRKPAFRPEKIKD